MKELERHHLGFRNKGQSRDLTDGEPVCKKQISFKLQAFHFFYLSFLICFLCFFFYFPG